MERSTRPHSLALPLILVFALATPVGVVIGGDFVQLLSAQVHHL
ncbi:hypothetical protein [Thiohalocapsa marina]|nr:hypothetical protein [Thiohalocapsa marina]